MDDMYEGDLYEKNNPTWHEQDSPWKAHQVEKMIVKNRLQPKTLCEIGCGTGEILLNLEKSLPPDVRLSGYEIAPRAFERAKLKETDRTRFHLADLLMEQEAKFDLVLAIDVLEHVKDYIGFIEKLKDVGTYKMFHIPLDLSAQSVARARPILNLRHGVGHLHYFFKQTALETLESCGYTILDSFYTASRLELPDQALSSRMMRIPRRVAFAVNPDLTVRVLGGYSLMVLAE